MRMIAEAFAVLSMLLLHAACASPDEEPPGETWQANDTTYVFDQPDDEFELPAELEEISGLTFLDDGMIGAVQDEDGDLYVIDPATGGVVDVRNFAGGGDYEGIELADAGLHVLRSNGRVYTFESWDSAEFEGDWLEYDVPKRCDAEGLAYQSARNRLLIACKEQAGDGLKGMKAIYAFDPSTNELDPEPAYVLDIDDFEANMEEHPVNEAVRSVLSDRLDLSGFKPSALAVHPRTGDVYVLSSVTKAMLRLDDAGAVSAIWMLPDELFEQPEGIAFDAAGTLYISNEAGDRSHATLLSFEERTDGSVTDSAPIDE